MLKKMLFSSIACVLLCYACNNSTPNKTTVVTPPTAAEQPALPMTGADSDEHGCKASAGFQWSVLKNECIQIFNAGICLKPEAKHLDKSLATYAVFKSEKDEAQVELFLPSEKPFLLTKTKDNGAGIWKNENYTLTQWKGMYSLEDSKKVLLYQGMQSH